MSYLFQQRFHLKRNSPNGEAGETMCRSLQTPLVDHKQLNKIDELGQKDSKDLTTSQSLAEKNTRSELNAEKAVEVLPW